MTAKRTPRRYASPTARRLATRGHLVLAAAAAAALFVAAALAGGASPDLGPTCPPSQSASGPAASPRASRAIHRTTRCAAAAAAAASATPRSSPSASQHLTGQARAMRALTPTVLYVLGTLLFLAGTALALLLAAGHVERRHLTHRDVRSSGCRPDNPANPGPERGTPTPEQGDNPATRQDVSPAVVAGSGS